MASVFRVFRVKRGEVQTDEIIIIIIAKQLPIEIEWKGESN